MPSPIDAQIAAAFERHRRGDLAEAEKSYRLILRAEPRRYDALHLLGLVLLQRGQIEEAERVLARSLAINDANPFAQANRGAALMELHRYAEALQCFDRATSLKPDYFDAFNDRGNVLCELGRLEEAVDSYGRAIALKPDFGGAYFNRGTALLNLERAEEALASYDRAIALKTQVPEALVNKGFILTNAKRVDEGIASFDRAIAERPGYAEALTSRGLAELLAGQMAPGWRDLEYRWRQKSYKSERPSLGAPHWSGEPVAGRSMLVYDEEGLGDTIQFCRYLPKLIGRGAKVSLLLRSKLSRLMETLSQDVQVVRQIGADDRFDFQAAMLSLPGLFGTVLDNIPNSVPYLAADPERSARMAGIVGDSGFKIGICWQGSPLSAIDAGRSIPLRAFYPLSQIPGVRLISLQKHYGLDQMANLPFGMEVETLGEDFDEGPDAFLDTAAAMERLDLIVSSDTAVAHLAGALARPVWVALKYVPDWRWMLDRSDSPWYPTMKLFRQPAPGDWSAVFHEISLELRKLRETSPAESAPHP